MSTSDAGIPKPDEATSEAALDPVGLWSAFKRAHEIVRTRVIADAAEAAGLSEPDLTILANLNKAGAPFARANSPRRSAGTAPASPTSSPA